MSTKLTIRDIRPLDPDTRILADPLSRRRGTAERVADAIPPDEALPQYGEFVEVARHLRAAVAKTGELEKQLGDGVKARLAVAQADHDARAEALASGKRRPAAKLPEHDERLRELAQDLLAARAIAERRAHLWSQLRQDEGAALIAHADARVRDARQEAGMAAAAFLTKVRAAEKETIQASLLGRGYQADSLGVDRRAEALLRVAGYPLNEVQS